MDVETLRAELESLSVPNNEIVDVSTCWPEISSPEEVRPAAPARHTVRRASCADS